MSKILSFCSKYLKSMFIQIFDKFNLNPGLNVSLLLQLFTVIAVLYLFAEALIKRNKIKKFLITKIEFFNTFSDTQKNEKNKNLTATTQLGNRRFLISIFKILKLIFLSLLKNYYIKNILMGLVFMYLFIESFDTAILPIAYQIRMMVLFILWCLIVINLKLKPIFSIGVAILLVCFSYFEIVNWGDFERAEKLGIWVFIFLVVGISQSFLLLFKKDQQYFLSNV